MTWEHKGMSFDIQTESMGPFVMASAQVPPEGPFVRVRPFTSLGRDQEDAVELLQRQIEFEFRRLPSPVAGDA